MDNFAYTTFVWDKSYLESILCSGKHRIISDANLLRGFKAINRVHFVPDEKRAIAFEDKDIDIGFGQKLYKPTTALKLISLLQPALNGNYLVIGAGTGYMSAIIGATAGLKGKVVAIERNLMLLDSFRENMAHYPELAEVIEPVFKDGAQGYPGSAPYDGILYTITLEKNPLQVISQLKVGGKLIAPRTDGTTRIMTRVDNINWSEMIYKDPLFLDSILEGIE